MNRRYGNLLPENAYFNWTDIPSIPIRSTVSFVLLSSLEADAVLLQDQSRVNVTAESFVGGFLGPDYADRSNWLITPDSIVCHSHAPTIRYS